MPTYKAIVRVYADIEVEWDGDADVPRNEKVLDMIRDNGIREHEKGRRPIWEGAEIISIVER